MPSAKTPLDLAIGEEIEALHRFLVAWFAGKTSEDSFDKGFSNRLDPDFKLIPPAGLCLSRSQVNERIKTAYASNPPFRIQIRNVVVQRVFQQHALVTYQEWQRNARMSNSANNGRVATALFKLDTPLQWLHIHETWLPDDIQSNDAYDF